MLARARRLDEEAAAAAVAAVDGYQGGFPGTWDGIDFSSAMSCRPCTQNNNDTDDDTAPSVAITIADKEQEDKGEDTEEGGV